MQTHILLVPMEVMLFLHISSHCMFGLFLCLRLICGNFNTHRRLKWLTSRRNLCLVPFLTRNVRVNKARSFWMLLIAAHWTQATQGLILEFTPSLLSKAARLTLHRWNCASKSNRTTGFWPSAFITHSKYLLLQSTFLPSSSSQSLHRVPLFVDLNDSIA